MMIYDIIGDDQSAIQVANPNAKVEVKIVDLVAFFSKWVLWVCRS